MASSVVIAIVVSCVIGKPTPDIVYMARSNLGVMAFCRLGGGLTLSQARISMARICGRKWGDPGTCTGLSLKLTLNVEATSLAAWRKVLATTGSERWPVSLPLVSQVAVR